jgi:crotonobetainyl-CoA:carnitine CoA-transferase CaiB-like acyl-CoA transferase
MAKQALSHLRVIDLTHYLAGPYCTKLLAGFGAEVIKIERPQVGDRVRSVGPFWKGEAGLEKSIPFLWLNTGKKSLTLNLKTDKGIAILKELVKNADLLVENFSPQVLPTLGITYESLQERNPRLVMTSITNFGQNGDYRNYQAEEIVAYAMSGLMYMTGSPEKPPLGPGTAICQYLAGQHAYVASLMALFERHNSGLGQQVDVSIQECALECIGISFTNYFHSGNKGKRSEHGMVPWDLYPCQDGYAAIISAPFRHWLRGAELFDEPRLFQEEYRHARDRIKHRREVEAMIKPWLLTQKKEDVFHAGQEKGLAFGYLANLAEAFQVPQHQDRGFLVELDHPVVGTHKYCDAPFKMPKSPWHSKRSPLLGEHNEEIYGTMLGYTAAEISALYNERII